MKKIITMTVAASAVSLTACGTTEPAPYGQDYMDQRPDGWQQEDGDNAVNLCHDELMEVLTPAPGRVTSNQAFTDQVFGSPTNLVVGGSAHAYRGDSFLDRRTVTYLCEVNDPLSDVPLVSVEVLP